MNISSSAIFIKLTSLGGGIRAVMIIIIDILEESLYRFQSTAISYFCYVAKKGEVGVEKLA